MVAYAKQVVKFSVFFPKIFVWPLAVFWWILTPVVSIQCRSCIALKKQQRVLYYCKFDLSCTAIRVCKRFDTNKYINQNKYCRNTSRSVSPESSTRSVRECTWMTVESCPISSFRPSRINRLRYDFLFFQILLFFSLISYQRLHNLSRLLSRLFWNQ